MFTTQLALPNLHPVCPIDLLPEPLRGAVLYAIGKKDIPAAVALTDAIAAAAAVVHCGFDCVTAEGESLPATINTCVLAPSAAGKGRSIKLFFKHFLDAHKQSRSPAIERDVRDHPIAPTRKPLVEAMVNNNISLRRLAQELDGVGMNLTIQREEGASFLKSDLFKDGTDALTQLWSGDPPFDHFVMGTELVATDARLSLGFRIQPELMYDYLRRCGRLTYALGFWPRAIVGCHDPRRFPENESYRSNIIRSSTDVAFQDRMKELAEWINSLRQSDYVDRIGVKLDAKATAFMLEIRYRMKSWKTNYYDDIEEAAGRAWENTLRVAVVLSVFCAGAGQVSLDMVERAWAIVEWSLSQHRLVFVSANQPAPKKAITSATKLVKPKPAKRPRPIEDAHFLLECLIGICSKHYMTQALLSDVACLAGLHGKRLETAVEWLKLEGLVETKPAGAHTVMRVIQVSCGSWRRASTGRL